MRSRKCTVSRAVMSVRPTLNTENTATSGMIRSQSHRGMLPNAITSPRALVRGYPWADTLGRAGSRAAQTLLVAGGDQVHPHLVAAGQV